MLSIGVLYTYLPMCSNERIDTREYISYSIWNDELTIFYFYFIALYQTYRKNIYRSSMRLKSNVHNLQQINEKLFRNMKFHWMFCHHAAP